MSGGGRGDSLGVRRHHHRCYPGNTLDIRNAYGVLPACQTLGSHNGPCKVYADALVVCGVYSLSIYAEAETRHNASTRQADGFIVCEGGFYIFCSLANSRCRRTEPLLHRSRGADVRCCGWIDGGRSTGRGDGSSRRHRDGLDALVLSAANAE